MLLHAINHNGISVFLLVSRFAVSGGLELTGTKGKRVDGFRQSNISHDVYERRVCDGDSEHLFNWCLPICMDGEGPEALEGVDRK